MPDNLIVLRASPDWLRFDPEQSRQFLSKVHLREDLIIEFLSLWRLYFKSDYRAIRNELKNLAISSFEAINRANFRTTLEPDDIQPDTRIAFVDDDDWMHPDLFDELPPRMVDEDGVFWGSVRIGRKFLPNASGDIVELRPLSRTIYTNNYVVTGRALRRLGVDAVFEHWEAQNAFDRPDFNATASSRYLSCAVKHPFSTVSVNFLMSREEFRSDPRVEMTRFMEKLEKVAPEALAAWLRPNFIRFRQIMREAIDPR